MKKGLFFLLLTCTFLARGWAQGIVFFEGTWEEALAKAKEEEKPIFVDAFTTWCGPCKVMAKNVFPDARVGELYNAGFINMQIDMEKEPGLLFEKKYPVSAYPTLFYIDPNGAVIKKAVGAQQVEGFIRLGQSVLATANNGSSAVEAYEKGDRSPEVVLKYIKSLNQSGKSSLKAANDYLRTQPDLSKELNLRIIYEATVQADSRPFELLVQHRKAITPFYTEAAVQERIYKACRNTADKALENQSEELLKEAKDKMKQHFPERAKAFGYQMDMEKALLAKDNKTYYKALDLFAKSAQSEPAAALRQTALYVSRHHAKEPAALSSAITLAGIAAQKAGTSGYYLDLAELHLQNGDKKNATEAANKAKNLAENEGQEDRQRVQQFFLKLN